MNTFDIQIELKENNIKKRQEDSTGVPNGARSTLSTLFFGFFLYFLLMIRHYFKFCVLNKKKKSNKQKTHTRNTTDDYFGVLFKFTFRVASVN